MISKGTTFVGDVLWVTLDRAGTRKLCKVQKINPKNIKVVLEDGLLLSADPYFLGHATPKEKSWWAPVSPDAKLERGVVVKYASKPGLWVICDVKIKGGTTYTVAPLGGGDLGYQGVSASKLEKVTFDVAGV